MRSDPPSDPEPTPTAPPPAPSSPRHSGPGAPDLAALILRAKLQWERTVDSVADLIAILDTDHRIVRVNRAMAERLGRTPGECVGLTCHEWIHGSDVPIASCPQALTLADGRQHSAEMHLQRFNGVFLVTTNPFRDETARLVGTVHVARDITEERRAQARETEALILAAASQTAVDILEAMGEGLLLLDPEGRTLAANPALVKMIGIRADDLIGRSASSLIDQILPPEEQALARDALATMLQGRDPALSILTLLDRSGDALSVIPAVTFVRGSDHRPTAIVVTLRDISALLAAQQKLEASRTQKETDALRYQQRLRALTVRLAETEDAERWRIARYIHDTIIQTLSLSTLRLRSMETSLTSVALVEETSKLGQVRELLDQAIDECRMVMSNLTPALLYELGLVPALKDLARQMEEKHAVRIVVEEDGPEADMPLPLRGLLFQSGRELLINALKHAGPCDMRVSVGCRDAAVTLRVSDNGQGFDPAAAATQDHSGGFGLFAIRQRLEGLDGRFEIDSALGKGTTATISVPLAAGESG